jgi:hypothetical protein
MKEIKLLTLRRAARDVHVLPQSVETAVFGALGFRSAFDQLAATAFE